MNKVKNKIILITGGAGFIGSATIKYIINNTKHSVINVDKLTYAGNLESLESIQNNPNYIFEKIDICDSKKINSIFSKHKPDIVLHLAAESHVDRSIDTPDGFIKTNILGTYKLLEQTRKYWTKLNNDNKKNNFRFHHVSTDEVYGDLKDSGNLFNENTPYSPSSPYSASKASSDHLVRAWQHTFGLPTLITNCSNNYGPYQFPEKLIPLIILNALEGKDLPVYGDGKQIRDWLHVDDHARILLNVALNGKIGETYNIGGNNEIRNIEVVKLICKILDELVPEKPEGITKFSNLIKYVSDRVGHDTRYAIDSTKIKKELGCIPTETFESGIRKTVQWYLENKAWCDNVQKGFYQRERLGIL